MKAPVVEAATMSPDSRHSALVSVVTILENPGTKWGAGVYGTRGGWDGGMRVPDCRVTRPYMYQ